MMVTFPISFTTTTYAAIYTHYNDTTNETCPGRVANKSVSVCLFYGTTKTQAGNYIAIGY